jgi:predicted metal-dependent phosphoesterase TrpH/anti-sigma regulatory factor (Ser/Thr protein kinase)
VYALDLHTHTCLSPCAELDMHPAGLVSAAASAGLDAVAVSDHNSAENIAATQRAGRTEGLAVIPGMEVTSEEEVHILGLFPALESALEMQSRVYRSLPGRSDPAVFGMQVVADEFAQVLGFNDRLLSGATTMSVESVVSSIHDVGGVAVASHVDRERFGILGQLGMIPLGLALDGLEVSPLASLPEARAKYAGEAGYPLLCNSDAHEPKDVGRALTYMLLQEPAVAEVRMALAGRNGRTILGGGRPMEDLALHVLDIAQNSIEAGATELDIELAEEIAADRFVIEVRDNGPGMSSEALTRATDPFFTTRKTRRVGLGLPLLAEAARATGGEISVDSKPGAGVHVRAAFRHGHIDRAPLGDIETTLMVLLAGHPHLRLRFRHRVDAREFDLDSRDLKAALDGADLGSPEGLALLRETIRRGESDLAREADDTGSN